MKANMKAKHMKGTATEIKEKIQTPKKNLSLSFSLMLGVNGPLDNALLILHIFL